MKDLYIDNAPHGMRKVPTPASMIAEAKEWVQNFVACLGYGYDEEVYFNTSLADCETLLDEQRKIDDSVPAIVEASDLMEEVSRICLAIETQKQEDEKRRLMAENKLYEMGAEAVFARVSALFDLDADCSAIDPQIMTQMCDAAYEIEKDDLVLKIMGGEEVEFPQLTARTAVSLVLFDMIRRKGV